MPRRSEIHRINRAAPDFTAAAVLPDGTIEENFVLGEAIRDRYAVRFFYPLAFTFGCPTELIAFHHRMPDFERRDSAVIGVSIDSQYSRLAWRKTPVTAGGVGALDYPLVADPSCLRRTGRDRRRGAPGQFPDRPQRHDPPSVRQ